MKQLTIMVGLPRSGKSTYAKLTGNPIVARDAVHHAMCGKQLQPLDDIQPMVSTFIKYMITALFQAGHDKVIYDACNHTKEVRARWITWCLFNGIECKFKHITTPMEICQSRAKQFKNADWLVPKIKEMYEEGDWIDD